MMGEDDLPKKILRIQELTFILPDDFDGSIFVAIDLLIKHLKSHKNKYISDNDSTMTSLLLDDKKSKLCAKYGIFENIDGEYKLVNKNKIDDIGCD
jgi:hypothetical protein